MPGEIAFGRYVLLNKLAVGGMAEIFVAQVKGEAGFRKTCVIKRVLPHLALRRGFREMFLDEAHIAARLNHPGIVQIFDLGRQGEDFYIAMEYLAGENTGDILRQCLKLKRSMPIEVCVRIVASAAEALHYAHELKDETGKPLGIVHRDVSPSNLFVTYQGAVKLLDFGIARAEQRIQETLGGQVKGKLAYMAPEQAAHEQVDRRADVWSLGVCLHEMLTGRRLFLRDSAAETASALVRAPITPCSFSRPEVPGELDEIIQSALTRDLAQRMPSAEALRVALERFLSARSSFSTTALLGEFVRDLFGAERAQERIQLGSTPQISDVAEPSAVEGTPMLSRVTGVTSNEARTILASPEEVAALVKRPRRRAPLIALGALVIAGGAFAMWRYRPTPPAPVAVTPPLDPAPPAPVAVAPPEPAPAPSPPAVETTEATPTHSAAPRHRDPGWLSVDSNVAARASLDGTLLGALPLSHVRVSAGEHRLKVENPSLGLSRTVRLRVAPGETLEHHAAVTLGTLNVTVSPWADVYLDGFHLGQTPLAGRQVAAAPHQLRLVGPNGEKTLQIDLKQNETRVVRETLP